VNNPFAYIRAPFSYKSKSAFPHLGHRNYLQPRSADGAKSQPLNPVPFFFSGEDSRCTSLMSQDRSIPKRFPNVVRRPVPVRTQKGTTVLPHTMAWNADQLGSPFFDFKSQDSSKKKSAFQIFGQTRCCFCVSLTLRVCFLRCNLSPPDQRPLIPDIAAPSRYDGYPADRTSLVIKIAPFPRTPPLREIQPCGTCGPEPTGPRTSAVARHLQPTPGE